MIEGGGGTGELNILIHWEFRVSLGILRYTENLVAKGFDYTKYYVSWATEMQLDI